jgi:hypothetical protein
MRSAGGCAVTILTAEGDQAVRALACTAGILSPARLSGLTAPLSGRPFTGEQRHPQPVSPDQTSRAGLPKPVVVCLPMRVL